MRLAIALATLFALSGGHAEAAPAPSNASSGQNGASPESSRPAPQWYLDDIEFLTRDGGRWVASNAEFQSEDEPMEAYVLEWKKGYANSMTGRLYGIVNGEPTGDFWQFRQYWHPGLGAAQLQQFGFGGAVGLGAIWQDGDVNKTKQTFFAPDGSAAEQGHEAHNPDADTHVTTSFDIVGDEWKTRRTYTWKRDKTVSGK
jgi:hypothetical protein